MNSAKPPLLSSEDWEQRYQEGRTAWDLGMPAPPLVTLLHSPTAPPIGRVAVLGSGRGHDALLFAERGFDVVGFDCAPSAIQAATTLAQQKNLAAQFLQRDIFALLPEWAEQFDYVLEHTCFCAIDPARRADYGQLVHGLLKPGGELIGLFWNHDRPGGPPFGSRLAEVEALLAKHFMVTEITPVQNSVSGRQHEENLIRAQKRPIKRAM